MSIQAQVKFPENIEHVDVTKPLVDQLQIKGTHWSVIDKTARNAISDDKREVGMLVTWIESFEYVTKRFEAVNTLDVNWTDDSKWFSIIDRNDTIIYADTSFFSLVADTANFAFKADSSGVADTAMFALEIATVDSINFNEIDLTQYNKGNLRYDSASQSLQFQNDLSDFNHNLGYEHVARYFNNTGTTIEDGELLTPFGQVINGAIFPTVKRAGNGSLDSIQMVAMSTTTTLDQTFGNVTLIGPVNGLNTSAFNDNDLVYVGNNGLYTNVNPEPPELSLLIGKVFYADNDSGQIYMFPGSVEFAPSPHISADTSQLSETVTINTQNIYEYVPIGNTNVAENFGFTLVGDSVQIDVAGYYTMVLSMTFSGNPSTETWRYGIFINNIEQHTKSRTTSSSDAGDVNVPISRRLELDDWLSFRIRNESGTNNLTVVDLAYEIIFLHL